MAEVTIEIRADDQASEKIAEIETMIEGLASSADEITAELAGAIEEAGTLSTLLAGAELSLDVSGALDSADALADAIEDLPDTAEVTVEWFTEASPVRPFGEGMAEIEERIAGLPTEGNYTLRVGMDDGDASWGGAGSASAVTLNTTINVSASGEGGDIARDIDAKLADLWNNNRSALRKAVEG